MLGRRKYSQKRVTERADGKSEYELIAWTKKLIVNPCNLL
jgi:hypothetical protein